VYYSYVALFLQSAPGRSAMPYRIDPVLLDADLALYVHIPFCARRCTYCAFNTYTGLDRLIPAYVEALCHEIHWVARATGKRLTLHTVYLGGGTPSVLSVEQIEKILQTVRAAFAVRDSAEITLEANPVRLEPGYLAGLRRLGVSRLSLGAQSAQASDLKLFNRGHAWSDVVVAVQSARAAGFDNLNLDLIYGVPGQSLASWQDSLIKTVALRPDHISLYSLGIETGTPLHRWVEAGRVPEPDSDLAADMYDYASEYLAGQGFEQYEISNWARPGFACQHNLQYWRRLPYLGVGAGGSGFVDPVRYGTVDHPAEYVRLLSDPQVDSLSPEERSQRFPLSPVADPEKIEVLDSRQARAEMMILGLRLVGEGVSRAAFAQRYGQTVEECYGRELERLEARGLLRRLDDRIVLTSQARLIANLALREFV